LHDLTDETGILQHAIFTIPNYREGYTTDDNARALMVSVLLEELGNKDATELATRYLAFTWYAFNIGTKRFRNFMDYQRNWLEESGSDDSHGRALWALGSILGRSNTPTLQNMAGRSRQRAHVDLLFLRPAELGRPQEDSGSAPRRMVGRQQNRPFASSD
jgi:hypothetical protein